VADRVYVTGSTGTACWLLYCGLVLLNCKTAYPRGYQFEFLDDGNQAAELVNLYHRDGMAASPKQLHECFMEIKQELYRARQAAQGRT
jgi:hypothetical protein